MLVLSCRSPLCRCQLRGALKQHPNQNAEATPSLRRAAYASCPLPPRPCRTPLWAMSVVSTCEAALAKRALAPRSAPTHPPGRPQHRGANADTREAAQRVAEQIVLQGIPAIQTRAQQTFIGVVLEPARGAPTIDERAELAESIRLRNIRPPQEHDKRSHERRDRALVRPVPGAASERGRCGRGKIQPSCKDLRECRLGPRAKQGCLHSRVAELAIPQRLGLTIPESTTQRRRGWSKNASSKLANNSNSSTHPWSTADPENVGRRAGATSTCISGMSAEKPRGRRPSRRSVQDATRRRWTACALASSKCAPGAQNCAA